jgi:dipeptide/tripeptide permease
MNSILERLKNFPKAAPYIVLTESAERFSFYGMKAILSTFLISQFFQPYEQPRTSSRSRSTLQRSNPPIRGSGLPFFDCGRFAG